jgi:hypothetical protein
MTKCPLENRTNGGKAGREDFTRQRCGAGNLASSRLSGGLFPWRIFRSTRGRLKAGCSQDAPLV